MITPEQIEHKAQRVWRAFLQAWLAEESFFPVKFPVGKLPMDDFDRLAVETKALIEQSKAKRGAGYLVQLQTQRTKAYGPQSLPHKIVIETEADYLAVVKRKGKFQQFKETVHLIQMQCPELESWLRQHPLSINKFANEWADLLVVCRYFYEHPRPNLYARELPIPVHTKFIEQHKGILRVLLDVLLPPEAVNPTESHFERRFGLRYDDPLIRLRFLAPAEQTAQTFPFDDFSIPVSQLVRWDYHPRRCLIVENKLTFLTLPALPDTLALWGGGFRVQLLSNLRWLGGGTVFYWGDLDAQGFQILSQLRGLFPHAISVMMDKATLEHFEAYVVPGTPTPVLDLPYLTSDEQQLYQHLQQANIRLEQERITPSYATHCLQSID